MKTDYIIRVLQGLLIVAVLVLFFWAIPLRVQKEVQLNKSQSACLQHGYPELIIDPDTKDYYCQRVENGNDVLVLLDDLE